MSIYFQDAELQEILEALLHTAYEGAPENPLVRRIRAELLKRAEAERTITRAFTLPDKSWDVT